MKNYRLVEITRERNERYGKKVRTVIFCGPEKEALKAAIAAWCRGPHKPWAETAYYYGNKQIYAYEL